MLPSTGYFKGITCPFYDSGLCERPYCHFRHVRRESQTSSTDGIESGAILQKLVSAAVQKVLQQTEPMATAVSPSDTDTVTGNVLNSSQTVPKATYNPTPISELNKINNTDTENNDEVNEQRKRHIPVPYTPRKPSSVIVKRPVEAEAKPFIYIPPAVKYTPGCTDTAPLDQYMPKGSNESNQKYLPGSEIELQEYAPNKDTQSSSKINYIPSDKSNSSKKKILEYKPTKVTKKVETPLVTYQPTPRSLAPCFSSDEDEAPDLKKRKLCNDLNGFDDLGPEFDILDQILDEEKSPYQNIKPDTTVEKTEKSQAPKESKDKIIKHSNNKSEMELDKKDSSKSNEKVKSDKEKQSSKSNEKVKSDRIKEKHKTKSSDAKSSHKSSHRDKSSREKGNNKDSSKVNSHSKSKSAENGSNEKKSKDSESRKKHSSSKISTKKEKSVKIHNRSEHKSNDRLKHSKSKASKEKDKNNQQKEFVNSNYDSDSNKQEMEDFKDEDLSNLSESDEEAIALECKKIFEDYVPTEKIKNFEDKLDTIYEEYEPQYVSNKKRISRTIDKNIKVTPKIPLKPDYKKNAAQTMAERISKMKEFHAMKHTSLPSITESLVTKTDLTNKNTASTSSVSKIRIAHVPYAATLMNAKKTIPSTKTPKPSTSITIIQTAQKGEQRVAHVPNEKFVDRPGVLEPLGSKIAANIRSTFLNMMIDECLKIYHSATDAYARAQHEELATSKKCSTVPIYKNSAVLTVSRLRKELQECNGVKKSGTDFSHFQKGTVSAVGNANDAGSWSIESKNRKHFDNPKEFKGEKLYQNIMKWILTESQLQENGFPRSHPSGEKGRAIIYSTNKQKPPKGFLRTCCRCKKEYTIDKKGFPSIKEDCIYHPNNKYRVRGEARYQCCSQDGASDGCCTAPSHVYEYVDYNNLKGFVKTLPPEREMDDYGVYSLDCEMCYTTQGLDLTRITVINSSCKVVYESFIKPLHPIIDYNTRYSGITEEHMAGVHTTLLDVQATLLSMFNNKTILVGHSLESDFKALKLIHDSVIDTSVLFPHKMGPPYKRALRNLSSEHLKKIIQNSVEGHDSAEDATVCMELIHYKLKEDLKTR